MNILTQRVRLYKLDNSVPSVDEVIDIATEIINTTTLWSSFCYEINRDSKYIEFVYNAKYPNVNYYDSLTEKYHVCIITGDQGQSDYIRIKSNLYNNLEVSERCIYKADRILFYGRSLDVESDLKYLYPTKDFSKSIDDDFVYTKIESIEYSYFGASLKKDFSKQNTIIEVNFSDFMFFGGEIASSICDSHKLMEELLAFPTYNFKSLFKIELLYMGRMVFRTLLQGMPGSLYWQNNIDNNGFENCGNEDFVNFKHALNCSTAESKG